MLQEKWSEQAKKDFDNIITYLVKEWPKTTAIKFIIDTERVIKIIKKSPRIFPQAKSLKVRKGFINDKISL